MLWVDSSICIAIMGEQPRLMARNARQPRADRAHADDAERHAGNLVGPRAKRPRGIPGAVFQGSGNGKNVAREHQQCLDELLVWSTA